MGKKKGTIWKNFLILGSFISCLIVIITFFIYRNAISVMKQEICEVNMNQARLVENNLVNIIEQSDSLAASLCIQEDTIFFWNQEQPELLDNDFYRELSLNLKSYVYSMRNYISSIMLYSAEYDRFLDESRTYPYYLMDAESDAQQNASWVNGLEKAEGEKVRTKLQTRAAYNGYPYVITLVKQFNSDKNWGAVAVDINLEKAYDIIWSGDKEDVKVWVLDEQGRVIIRDKKNELYAYPSEYEDLKHFDANREEVSVISEDGETPISYVQRYLGEYDMYIVVVSALEDFDDQMQRQQIRAIGIGIICIIIACFLAWLYVYIVNKPLKNILSLLKDPGSYDSESVSNEKDVQEIVELIIANLQKNDVLREELENRMEVLQETQLQALKAQINPHFLFNTLNVIVMMIDEELEESQAAQVTADLADVLHYALSDEHLVPLRDELKNAEKYISIMEKRYRNLFKVKFDIDEELMDMKVPKLILQPLIENAISHGFVAKKVKMHGLYCQGELFISGRKQLYKYNRDAEWYVHIEVADNGQGMEEDEMNRLNATLACEHISMKHIGITNVAKRLQLLFPQKSRMEIRSRMHEGTRITLVFPYLEDEELQDAKGGRRG